MHAFLTLLPLLWIALVVAVAVVVRLWVGVDARTHTRARRPMTAEDKKKVANILRSAGVRASLGVY